MSIMSYSGGTVVAMAGEDCICIGTDLRIGEQTSTIAMNIKKVHKVTDKVYVGLCGFNSDADTVLGKIMIQKNLYELRENRTIKPQVVATILSNLLYSRRFGNYFVSPIVAGLDPLTSKPYICAMDVIGNKTEPEDFVVCGTAEEYCLGVCEGFWRPNMKADDLFEATAQSLLSALERDAASGCGALIYTITKDKVNVKTIKTRLD